MEKSPKVRTIKIKKERIKYIIVNCMEQEVVDQINESNIDSILELTKKVLKKAKFVSYFNKLKMAQGYNWFTKEFKRKNRKISTGLYWFICFPKLAILGFGKQNGMVKDKVNGVKLAFPAE